MLIKDKVEKNVIYLKKVDANYFKNQQYSLIDTVLNVSILVKTAIDVLFAEDKKSK